MHARRVSPALHERLGDDGSQALVELFDEVRRDWTTDVMDRVGDRFERRLVEETAAIRVEMAGMRGDLRQEITQLGSDLRQEMAQLGSDLRKEMAQLGFDLRQEMAAGFAAMRQDMAEQRFELLKWAFLFWIGQFFAVASLVAIVIRYVNPG